MPLPANNRFRLTMFMSKTNCPIEEDIYIVKDKDFLTLMDISKYLNISYSVINAIYKKKTEKYGKASCIPTIEIKNIV